MKLKKPEKHGLMPASNINQIVCIKCNEVAKGKTCNYNQGLSDMEAYYEGSELSKKDIKKIFIDMFGVYPDYRGCSELEENIDRFCQALIDARDKKRREG